MKKKDCNSSIVTLSRIKKLPNRTIEIKCKAAVVKAYDLVTYVDMESVKACENGCPNYAHKWSCPPYSKDYIQVSKSYEYAFLFCLYTDMDKYLDIKNKYLALKAANVTLKTVIEKMARELEEQLKGYALLSGSCRLCKPCNCKIGKPCKRPQKMRYSMEAAHLDVNKISTEKLEHPLLWYKNKQLPQYTSTVSLVLTNNELGKKLNYIALENAFKYAIQ